jgi:hypothetical protein
VSALEPDAPAPHLFPVWREAVRSWHVGRFGRQPSRGATGSEPRGKGPGMSDLLRVGRAMAELQLLGKDGKPNRHGVVVIEVALGLRPRCSDQGVKTLVQRVERHLRRAGIVKPATRSSATARWRFTLKSGEVADHAYLVDSG